MATVKVSASTSGGAAINYAKNKAVVMDGLNVDPEYAIGQMEHVRQVYDKTDGTQVHLFIQAFPPNEVTPQQANELGMELAKGISQDNHYQVAVYTHADTDHVHNHIVLNAVDYDNGMKYHQDFDVKRVREINDTICKEHGLSIPEKSQLDKTPMAELKAKEKGEVIWKDELRTKITQTLNKPTTVDHEKFKTSLAEQGIDVRYRGNGVSYSFVDGNGKNRISRASKLGENYGKNAIEQSFAKNVEKAVPKEVSKAVSTESLKEKVIEPSQKAPQQSLSEIKQKINKNWTEIKDVNQKMKSNKEVIKKMNTLEKHQISINNSLKNLNNNRPTFWQLKKQVEHNQQFNRLSEKNDKVEREINALKPRYQQAIKDNRILNERGSELAIQNRHLYDKKNELELKKEPQKNLEGKKESQKQYKDVQQPQQNNGFSLSDLKQRSKEIESKRKQVKQHKKQPKSKELER